MVEADEMVDEVVAVVVEVAEAEEMVDVVAVDLIVVEAVEADEIVDEVVVEAEEVYQVILIYIFKNLTI